MAVNIAEIGTVYDALEAKMDGTLEKFLSKYTISEPQKAQIVSASIVALLEISTKTVQNQPLIDAQVAQANAQIGESNAQTAAINSEKAIKEAQSAKDLLTKDAQVAHFSAQTAAINSEKAIKEAQSAKDLLTKDAQVGVINAQKDVEIEKKSLTIRQKDFYNDQLRMEEGKNLSTITMGALQSGTTLPSGLLETTLNAVASITP